MGLNRAGGTSKTSRGQRKKDGAGGRSGSCVSMDAGWCRCSSLELEEELLYVASTAVNAV